LCFGMFIFSLGIYYLNQYDEYAYLILVSTGLYFFGFIFGLFMSYQMNTEDYTFESQKEMKDNLNKKCNTYFPLTASQITKEKIIVPPKSQSYDSDSITKVKNINNTSSPAVPYYINDSSAKECEISDIDMEIELDTIPIEDDTKRVTTTIADILGTPVRLK